MSEPFEIQAHDYLLNQMEAARRRAFEEELQRNPAARAALKACAQALAGFACDVAGAEAMSAADHQAALAAIVEATQPLGAQGGGVRSGRWQRFLWPAAAALLLALNLFEFERPLTMAPAGRGASDRAAGNESKRGENSDARAANSTGSKQTADAGTGPASTGNRTEPIEPSRPERDATEIARLRASVAELQQTQDRIRAEYDALVRRIAAQAVVDRDLNRLATMELVDEGSFARGERKGLVNEGRGILTEPGVVTVSEPPPPAGGASSTGPLQPYAWSVFDEKEHRGYLNLYHLPTLTTDQAMQIWVRPGDAVDFQRVGEVPSQYSGGGGSVQYALPGATSAPAEILITIEPRSGVPSAPTGPRVLRGP